VNAAAGRSEARAPRFGTRLPSPARDPMNGWKAEGEFRTLDEAADWLITEAQITLPQPRDEAQKP
jgi:hypothetical protein